MAGMDLAPTLTNVRGVVVGIQNIMDKGEILTALKAVIESEDK